MTQKRRDLSGRRVEGKVAEQPYRMEGEPPYPVGPSLVEKDGIDMSVRLISAGVLMSIVALLIIAYSIAFPWQPPKPRDFQLGDLLIGTEILPIGWLTQTEPDEPDDAYGQLHELTIAFVHKPTYGLLWHTVIQFRNARSAQQLYRSELPSKFNEFNQLTPWESPSDLRFQSAIADQWRFACSAFLIDPLRKTVSGRDCAYFAQYEEVVVELSVHGAPEDPDVPALRKILAEIDGRMRQFLKR